MKIQHIGYFGEDEDVRYLANENTDNIIEYYRNGYGNFSIVEDEPFDTNDIGIEIDDESISSDKKFVVRKDLPLSENDSFIDIYEIIE